MIRFVEMAPGLVGFKPFSWEWQKPALEMQTNICCSCMWELLNCSHFVSHWLLKPLYYQRASPYVPSIDMFVCLRNQLALTEHRPPSSSCPCSGWFTPKPEVYARHAISTLGVSSRTTGYWPHTLQVTAESSVSQRVFGKVDASV